MDANQYPKGIVNIALPIYPSHVFLGDNGVSGCRPNNLPNPYAKMSFATTVEKGTIAQIDPSNIVRMMGQHAQTTSTVLVRDHAN